MDNFKSYKKTRVALLLIYTTYICIHHTHTPYIYTHISYISHIFMLYIYIYTHTHTRIPSHLSTLSSSIEIFPVLPLNIHLEYSYYDLEPPLFILLPYTHLDPACLTFGDYTIGAEISEWLLPPRMLSKNYLSQVLTWSTMKFPTLGLD